MFSLLHFVLAEMLTRALATCDRIHKSLHDSSILREIDTNNNGKVELEEYLAVMCAIKTGAVSHSR